MKKHLLFNLQLFAEDPATEPEISTDTENTTEDKEPSTEQKQDGKGKAKKYDDDDVNNIIKQKKAEWQKAQQKAVDEAKKLADMNATQKAEYERDKLQKELDEYKRKDALAEMSKTARKMLADENISISDDLLSLMVTTEAETTKPAIDNFIKLYKEAVESGVKERLRGETPKAGGGNPSPLSEIDKRIKKYE